MDVYCSDRLLSVMLGPVPRICNVLILLTCLDPWDKPKDDVEMMRKVRHQRPCHIKHPEI